jgi:hypothetical protein
MKTCQDMREAPPHYKKGKRNGRGEKSFILEFSG